MAGDPIGVLPVLFHLMWRGDLLADVSVPVHDATWSVRGQRDERADAAGALRIGDRVRFGGGVHQVVGIEGTTVPAGRRRTGCRGWPRSAT